MIKANFFIIGAPKCGTTSLAQWLAQHPDVFMSDPKEPRFFNADWGFPFRIEDLDAYAALFADSGDRRAIGEASTGYLVSDLAVPAILNYQPGAQFVVCLRNPVDLFFSLHGQRLKEGNETLLDPADAWEAQAERLKGRGVPSGVADPKSLHYDRFCSLGTQIEQLYHRVPRDHVFLVLMDELRDKPDATFRALCRFLKIEELSLSEYVPSNTGRLPRSLWLQRTIRLAGLLKRRVGLPSLGIATRISNVNLSLPLPAQDPALRSRLAEHFAGEVNLLQQVTGRDLSHWTGRSRGKRYSAAEGPRHSGLCG